MLVKPVWVVVASLVVAASGSACKSAARPESVDRLDYLDIDAPTSTVAWISVLGRYLAEAAISSSGPTKEIEYELASEIAKAMIGATPATMPITDSPAYLGQPCAPLRDAIKAQHGDAGLAAFDLEVALALIRDSWEVVPDPARWIPTLAESARTLKLPATLLDPLIATLNAKADTFAVWRALDAVGKELPAALDRNFPAMGRARSHDLTVALATLSQTLAATPATP